MSKKITVSSEIGAIHPLDNSSKLPRPLLGPIIQAGFPSPAQDYIEKALDLNEFLIQHPSATYFIRVDGYSMTNAGINPGDILIVDRSLEPAHNKIIIAVFDGELTVKRLVIRKGIYYLSPENDQFPELEITEDTDFSVWGVVTFVIHKV
ncbi:MAG: translesion error-prone DNA polymerase V autoproteolytic subunit [Candidatus Zophobacter franzmannii]|jgi:DNA polymerase V|nr:translesion error-prone DNA polymerase V autoproteolytic subunit [Candidatus Zophobacter franzmannii]